ncbi:M13 family metallopeptidase [uncultured Lactobacillus sp.]|uniref:M13 family metallopeptidase n=1 Tax=uncultured Lactobacillus sp. TaxID=153152 RepID=UPI0028046EA0|nr:M13 family metallopeptidase [uncultured Lactobacillus sp.]
MRRFYAVRGGAGDVAEPDVNAKPKDNLYLAVNSEWLSKAEIPADRTSTGVNSELDIRIEDRVMKDFADIAAGKEKMPDIKDFAKAIELYKIAKNFEKRDAEKAQPIQHDLEQLLSLTDFADLAKKTKDLFMGPYTLPFVFDVDADMKNTDVNVLYFGGPSTFLPDTTTYKTPDAKKLLDILQDQSINLLTMAGIGKTEARVYVDNALAFDAKVAKVVKSAEEWADDAAIYNPVSYDEFIAKFKSFNMAQFLDDILPEKQERVIVMEPRFLDHAEELINAENFDEIKGWMLVKYINNVAKFLSQEFREASFPYGQAITGAPELPSQIKQAFRLANGVFDEVVGIFYGKKYFGEKAKHDVEDMIHNMLKVYEERIKNNTWLSDETKKKAVIKLKALVLKIGYPEKIEKIFDLLQVDPEKSLYENEAAMDVVRTKYMLEKLTKPVDRSVWLMPGNLNNACYDPQRNDLTFPAGILQKPFYDINQSLGANYGGIGATIGHEVSHAFDNNGAKFDEKGNMSNWWTKQDFAEFNKRVGQMADIFDGLQYGPAKVNGKQVVSENIADLAGLACAVQTGKNDGANLKDLFENYARSWMEKQRPEAIKTEVQTDVHAPQPTRVNIPVQCQDEFYQVFDVKPGDGMWLDPEERITIW